jgi:hypothetical protein
MTDNSACTCSPNGCYGVALRDVFPNTCITALKEPVGTVQSVSFGNLESDAGSCAAMPTGGPAPLTWLKSAVACGAGMPAPRPCSDGQVCLPPVASPFPERYCVYASGDVDCPAGPYNRKQVFFQSAKDERGCAPCACAKPAGVSCSVTIFGYESAQCAPPVLMVDVSTGHPSPGCVMGPNAKYFKQSTPTVAGGSCTPSQSAPTGTAVPSQPTTFCCDG